MPDFFLQSHVLRIISKSLCSYNLSASTNSSLPCFTTLMCHHDYRKRVYTVKLDREEIPGPAPEPRMHARLKNHNFFPLSKRPPRNRAFMRGPRTEAPYATAPSTY
jgi:hypothetical protein